MEGEIPAGFCFDDDVDDEETTFATIFQQDAGVDFSFPSPENWILADTPPLSAEITRVEDAVVLTAAPSLGTEPEPEGEKTEITRSQRQRYRKRKFQLQCEKKRRDKLREKLRCLKEMLPNASSKLDQATLLDEAAKRIKLLQSQLQMMMIQGTNTWPPKASPQMGGVYPQFPYHPFTPASFFYPPPRTSSTRYTATTEPVAFLPVPPPGIIVPWAYQGQSSSSSQFPDSKQLP